MKSILLVVAIALVVSHAFELDASSEAPSSCSGKCVDVNQYSCSKSFQRGKCPGAANVQCCTGTATKKSSSSSPKNCAEAKGTCFDTKHYTCSNDFKKGLCSGGATNLCCTGTAKKKSTSSLTSSSSSSSSSGPGKLPSWKILSSCYPQGTSPEVKKRLGGAVNGDWITNTCAIRMSACLNCLADKTKDKLHLVPNGGSETIRDKQSNQLFYRVKQLSPVVKKKYGKPDLTVKTSSGRGVNPAKFKGRKGIIYFNTQGAWSDATGHFDLWDGHEMYEINHRGAANTKKYFDLSIEVMLWEADK